MEETITKPKNEEETKLENPGMFNVFLLNDNYSTFDFVMKILTTVFGKTREDAEKITIEIHISGEGLVGTYVQDIALTKIYTVTKMAEAESYPLKAVIK